VSTQIAVRGALCSRRNAGAIIKMQRFSHHNQQHSSSAHSNGKRAYIFSGIDQSEINRLKLQHFMFRREFGNDFSSPVNNPQAILDVACGPGDWIAEQARRFPLARCIGFDIQKPHLTSDPSLPNNCILSEGDALGTLPYGSDSFSLVMVRSCSAFIPRDRWGDRLQEMFRLVQPGGWLEIRDFGVVISESEALSAATTVFTRLAEYFNVYPGVGSQILELITKAYLPPAQIEERTVVHVPHQFGGSTPGGSLMLSDYLAVLKRASSNIVKYGFASREDWEHLLATAETEVGLKPGEMRRQRKTTVQITSAFLQKSQA
jgi:ubiquinone/menaquinone biosynthesis C-methylase UbiE